MSPVGWAEKKGGHTIQDEGADLPAKDNLDFQGTGVSAANVGDATVVSITAGGGGPGSDTTAIHDNVAAEISAIAEKAVPINADLLVIEDSAAGNVKKRVQLGNLPYPQIDDPTAIHDDVAGEIAAIAEKAVPVDADMLVIEDSAALNVKKMVQIGNLPYPQIDDPTAIHDDVAGEIAAVTEKVAPIAADMLLIEDSAALNIKKMVQIGNLPAAALAADTLCVFRPYQNEPPAANYATLDLSNNRPCLDFDAATDESAVFADILPLRYGGGGLDIILHLAATSDTTTTHRSYWDVSIEAIAAQVLSADGFAAAQSGNVGPPATYIETTLTISFTSGAQMDSLAAGGAFRLKVTRDANNGSDDWSGDAELLCVEVRETP